MTGMKDKQAPGTFYGIGVGPGDPELLTLKAVRVLSESRCVYLPTSRLSTQDYVSEVVRRYAAAACEICPVTFSLAPDSERRREHWRRTAIEIAGRLRSGQDVAFVTLGDALLYSTYIYLVRALRREFPAARIETVPGISSFSLAAALTHTPLGEGRQPLRVIPSTNDLGEVEAAVASGDCVVLMKIGPRLGELISLLDRLSVLERTVFVSRAGLPDQFIETDPVRLSDADEKLGNLAVMIVQGTGERA